MNYRREIDGLRALAVMPVILFHAGFETFSGGFVGVDIFFVISGYLITTIILAELEAEKFSIINFYERRARRILPAMFFVMLVSLPFAWLWLIPTDLRQFSQSLIAVVGFVSNLFFWQTSGYFQTAAELNPLLHTWSLAVEEQFYLFFPIFLLLAWKLGKQWILALLTAVFITSLFLAEWGTLAKPSATFYLLPTRCWELIAGSFVAFWLYYQSHRVVSKSISEFGGMLGLVLIAIAVFTFEEHTRVPGLFALIPVVGTVLIILFTGCNTLAGKLLGSKILVGVGLISYSAYLWHQPLFAFAKQRSIEHPGQFVFSLLALSSLVLAGITWKFVEAPFRNKNDFSRKQIFSFAVLGSFLFVCVGFAGYLNSGFEGRFSVPATVSQSLNVSKYAETCFDKNLIHSREDWYCDLGLKKGQASFFVFGDSHSLSLHHTFNSIAKDLGQYGLFTGASGCTPFLGIYPLRTDQAERNCNLLNKRVFDFVKDNKIEKVFLVSRWTYYTDGGYSGDDFSYISTSPKAKSTKEESRKAFAEGLAATVKAYHDAGIKLYVITQMPEQRFKAKLVYYKLYKENSSFDEELLSISVSRLKHQELQSYVMSLFQPLNSKGQIRLINFDNFLCSSDTCPIGTPEKSFYLDDNHLSLDGEALLKNGLLKYVAE